MTTKKTTKKTAKKTTTTFRAGEHVVVCTPSRPWQVLLGEYVSHDEHAVTLRGVRQAVYYDSDTRGSLGLATRGPGTASRITDRCDAITVRYESIARANDAAVARWAAEPWA
jgi:hypothetical protein